MEEVNIKIYIADKEFSLKASQEDEQHLINAAHVLNERIKLLKEKTLITDKSELLSIEAFDATLRNLQLTAQIEELQKRMEYLDTILSNVLNHTS
jgi:cell division protein ZapA